MSLKRLDLKDLKCPLPAFRTKKYIANMQLDSEVIIETTDPLSEIDIPHAIRQTNAKLLSCEKSGAVFMFHIKMGDISR